MSADGRDPILTISEVAADLRCSKPHVYNIISGTVPGISPLPVIQIGRRKLVRLSTLEKWKQANETVAAGDNLRRTRVSAVGRMEGEIHA